MPQLKLTIDGDTVMDTDLSEWTSQPVAIGDLKLRAAEDPWAIPAMQAIAAAVIRQRDTTITICTGEHGWGMDVSW